MKKARLLRNVATCALILSSPAFAQTSFEASITAVMTRLNRRFVGMRRHHETPRQRCLRLAEETFVRGNRDCRTQELAHHVACAPLQSSLDDYARCLDESLSAERDCLDARQTEHAARLLRCR